MSIATSRSASTLRASRLLMRFKNSKRHQLTDVARNELSDAQKYIFLSPKKEVRHVLSRTSRKKAAVS